MVLLFLAVSCRVFWESTTGRPRGIPLVLYQKTLRPKGRILSTHSAPFGHHLGSFGSWGHAVCTKARKSMLCSAYGSGQCVTPGGN